MIGRTLKAFGLEAEGTWAPSEAFSVGFALGVIDIEISAVDERVQGIEAGDSPALTPKFTASLSPRYRWRLASGAALTACADYYRRGRMFGQPINSPLNRIPALGLASAQLEYESAGGGWQATLYGYNLTDERYALAKLDLDPTVLTINSNDRREFGVRFGKRFGRAAE